MIANQFKLLEHQLGKGILNIPQTAGFFCLSYGNKLLKIPYERYNGARLSLDQRLDVVCIEDAMLEIVAPHCSLGLFVIIDINNYYQIEYFPKLSGFKTDGQIVDYALAVHNQLPIDLSSNSFNQTQFRRVGANLKRLHDVHTNVVIKPDLILSPIDIVDVFEIHSLLGNRDYVQHIAGIVESMLRGIRACEASKAVRLHGNFTISNTILVSGNLCVINPAPVDLFGSPLMDLSHMVSSLYYARKYKFINNVLESYYSDTAAVKDIEHELNCYVAYFLLKDGYEKLKLASQAVGNDRTYLLRHGMKMLAEVELLANNERTALVNL